MERRELNAKWRMGDFSVEFGGIGIGVLGNWRSFLLWSDGGRKAEEGEGSCDEMTVSMFLFGLDWWFD